MRARAWDDANAAAALPAETADHPRRLPAADVDPRDLTDRLEALDRLQLLALIDTVVRYWASNVPEKALHRFFCYQSWGRVTHKEPAADATGLVNLV